LHLTEGVRSSTGAHWIPWLISPLSSVSLVALDPSANWQAKGNKRATLPGTGGIQWLGHDHAPLWPSLAWLAAQNRFYCVRRLLGVRQHLMLPEAQDMPPHLVESSQLCPVPVDVLTELLGPEGCP
jgi:hypothetical protein